MGGWFHAQQAARPPSRQPLPGITTAEREYVAAERQAHDYGPQSGNKSQMRAADEIPAMDDQRIGAVIRLVRIRRGWRQTDLAAKTRVSKSAISRLERGFVGAMSVGAVRAVAAALEIRVDLVPRWRAGDLDRLLNSRHSALHESVARWFRDRHTGWMLAPEVTFSIYGDRGVIDILAWHPGRRALLVIELKTEIVDVNEVLGTLDRKARLASRVARERGWDPVTVSVCLIVEDSKTNRRRVRAHDAMVRNALPDERARVQGWLRDPVGRVNGQTFWPTIRGGVGAGVRRVRAKPPRHGSVTRGA